MYVSNVKRAQHTLPPPPHIHKHIHICVLHTMAGSGGDGRTSVKDTRERSE